MKYIGIKIRGASFWIWFDKEKVVRTDEMFDGIDGIGKNGMLINVHIDKNEIVGTMEADEIPKT